jgi:hypothetical protein
VYWYNTGPAHGADAHIHTYIALALRESIWRCRLTIVCVNECVHEAALHLMNAVDDAAHTASGEEALR